jgi:hypothetical protein
LAEKGCSKDDTEHIRIVERYKELSEAYEDIREYIEFHDNLNEIRKKM